MKARVNQNLLTSDAEIYRDIDTEIQDTDVKQWGSICKCIASKVEEQKVKLDRLHELINSMRLLTRNNIDALSS